MVGYEARHGYYCHYLQGLCFHEECTGLRSEGVGFPTCLNPVLAARARADDGRANDQATSQASAAAGFHDQGASRHLPLEGPQDASSGKVLSIGLVYRKPT